MAFNERHFSYTRFLKHEIVLVNQETGNFTNYYIYIYIYIYIYLSQYTEYKKQLDMLNSIGLIYCIALFNLIFMKTKSGNETILALSMSVIIILINPTTETTYFSMCITLLYHACVSNIIHLFTAN